MIIKVKLDPVEIELSPEAVRDIAEQEIKTLTDRDIITADYRIRDLVDLRIQRLCHMYDKGKMDFIREQLGITDEE